MVDGPVDVVSGVLQLVVSIAVLLCLVRIVQKAGYSGWSVLLGLLPCINVSYPERCL